MHRFMTVPTSDVIPFIDDPLTCIANFFHKTSLIDKTLSWHRCDVYSGWVLEANKAIKWSHQSQ